MASARCRTLRRRRSRRWCRVAPRRRERASSRAPSRRALSEITISSMPSSATACSNTMAPPRRMSARAGSTPGSLRRSATVSARLRSVTTRRISLSVSTKLLKVRGAGPPRRAWAMAATVSAVPDEAMATPKPQRSTSRTMGARAERTCRRQASTAPGWRRSPLKKRRVRRMAPSLRLPAARVSPRSPTRISVLPPPMSMSTRRWSNTGTACRTPRWMSRASSTPEITSTSMPASSRTRSRNSLAFSASRTALGGHGVDVGVVDLGEPNQLDQRVHAAIDGVGSEHLHVARARAETDHDLLPGDHLERRTRPGRTAVDLADPGDDHVERVGADVDGREGAFAHAITLAAGRRRAPPGGPPRPRMRRTGVRAGGWCARWVPTR